MYARISGLLGRRLVFSLLAALVASTAPAQAPVQLTVRDGAGQPVPEAVVYLQGPRGGSPVPSEPAVIEQRDKVFVPAVTVIQRGMEVLFPNNDSVSHHVYSFARPNAFELPLYKGDSKPVVRFDNPGVVTLGCNIHDAMLGWIVVVDTPYYARTDAGGVARLDHVAEGDYEAFVWSPRLDPARPLSAGNMTVSGRSGSRSLAIGARMREVRGGGALAGEEY